MSNQFGILSDETFAEKMDTQNQFLAAILSAKGGSVVPTSFKEIQTLVRSGLANKVFHIGDQLVCSKDGTPMVWDIIGINHDTPADKQFKHSMTLQLHDCLAGMQYDSPEALYFCEKGLSAGTYHFSLLAGYETSYGGGKTFQFTLTQPVPAGGQLVFPWVYNTQASTVNVSSYASKGATNALETVAVTQGAGGTALGNADGTTANMNHTHRIRYGSNNWKESAIRQWINSNKAAGSVWSPQTKFDRPPSWAASTAGFLNGLDEDFLAVIGETEKVTCRNTVNECGGSDVTADKFFLLSRGEAYAGNENSSVVEGEPYPFYSDYSDLSAPGTGNDGNRVKYRNGSAQYWWLRSPNSGVGNYVRTVNSAGTISHGAYNGNGVAPACNII